MRLYIYIAVKSQYGTRKHIYLPLQHEYFRGFTRYPFTELARIYVNEYKLRFQINIK